MSVRVAINGFGRIGRAVTRIAETHPGVEVVAVNDVADPHALARLLRHDSVYGRFGGEVVPGDEGMYLDGRFVGVLSEPDPAALPWDELGIDVVIEATGRFRTRAGAAQHLAAGARKVIISAPAKGDEPADADVVLGVNFHDVYDPERHHVITNASCTTNCLAPVAKVLHQAVGIEHGTMTTIHAYTADQRLHDAPHKDPRRARAAALNLVPTTTGAAKALGLVIPDLAGRLDGIAVRVPTPTGSIVDLTIESRTPTTVKEINRAFREEADHGTMAGILHYSEEPLVSTDIVGSSYSAVFDAGLTSVVGMTQVKVVAWYDNEWGYATRLVELAERVLVPVPA